MVFSLMRWWWFVEEWRKSLLWGETACQFEILPNQQRNWCHILDFSFQTNCHRLPFDVSAINKIWHFNLDGTHCLLLTIISPLNSHSVCSPFSILVNSRVFYRREPKCDFVEMVSCGRVSSTSHLEELVMLGVVDYWMSWNKMEWFCLFVYACDLTCQHGFIYKCGDRNVAFSSGHAVKQSWQ